MNAVVTLDTEAPRLETEATSPNTTDPDSMLQSSGDDKSPLEGLKHLGPVATVGAKALRALAAQPVTWAWDDFVPAGGAIAVLAGPSSEGKTTLGFLILLARLSSQPLMLCGRTIRPAATGTFAVLIEGEHGDVSTARKLVNSAALLGLGDDALERVIVVARKALLLGSPEWRDVERLIARGLVCDAMVDTLARCAPGDANSEAEQVAAFATLAAAIERAPSVTTRPTMWVVAHTRKGDASSLDDVGGSMQRVGQADSVIMVRAERADSGQVVASRVRLMKAREEPREWPEEHRLVLCGDRIEFAPADGGAAGKGATAAQRKVLTFLGRSPNTPRSANEVKAATGRSHNDVLDALQDLADAGHVVRVPVGGGRFKYGLASASGLTAERDEKRDPASGLSPAGPNGTPQAPDCE